MLLDSGNPDHRGYSVYDCVGGRLGFVKSYDTESKEIEMFIPAAARGERASVVVEPDNDPVNKSSLPDGYGAFRPVTVKFVLEGSYAKGPDGKKVEK
jgi:hypothetical protein